MGSSQSLVCLTTLQQGSQELVGRGTCLLQCPPFGLAAPFANGPDRNIAGKRPNMPTVVVLAIGLIVVIGGILLLRMHAFVALILAALLVAALSSPDAVVRSQVLSKSVSVTVLPSEEIALNLRQDLEALAIVATDRELDTSVEWTPLPGSAWGSLNENKYRWRLRKLADQTSNAKGDLTPPHRYAIDSMGISSRFRTDLVSFRIAPITEIQTAEKMASQSPILRVTNAFGSGAGKLAILIVAASIIGYCLLHSGAADQVVRSFLSVLGEKASPAAFALSGFVLAIPVFFDTVFLLMIPLAKSLYHRTGRNYLLCVLAIVVGGTMAHSLVPPTPGPLFIAEQFNVPITSMMFGGIVVGAFASTCGVAFAYWANKRSPLVPPEFQSANSERTDAAEEALDTDKSVQRPPLWESLLPVLLPVALMAFGTGFDEKTGLWQVGSLTISKPYCRILEAVCERNMALIIGATLATWTFVRLRRPGREKLAAGMQSAITSAGSIILVTAAGGAYGKMMEQTAVAELLQQIPAASPITIVLAAFFVTTVVRTAQGSATVAMMTAAGVFGGLVTSGAAGVEPLYVALAVGCGSKPFPWMNDSGFLVITRMSGMTESQGLRTVTPVVSIGGFAGLVAVICGVLFFPNL